MPRDHRATRNRWPVGNKTRRRPDTLRRAKRRGDKLAERIDLRRVERAAGEAWPA